MVENIDNKKKKDSHKVVVKKDVLDYQSTWLPFVMVTGFFIFLTFVSWRVPTPFSNGENYFSKDRFFSMIVSLVSLVVLSILTFVIQVFVFGGENKFKTFLWVFVPLLIVLLPVFLMIEFLPFFVEIFENSVGYGVLKWLPMIQYKPDISSLFSLKPPFSESPLISKDTSFLVTLFSAKQSLFDEMFNKIKNPDNNLFFIHNPANDDNDSLMKNVLLKNRMGKLCWLYLASVLGVFLSLAVIH